MVRKKGVTLSPGIIEERGNVKSHIWCRMGQIVIGASTVHGGQQDRGQYSGQRSVPDSDKHE